IIRAHIAPDWSAIFIPGSVTKPEYDLPLSGAAAELLRQHFPEGAKWAFEHLGPFAPLKRQLDANVAQVAPWHIHDIRHTVRSLLPRVVLPDGHRVTPDIAELCLGHKLKGMRKVYDHYTYEPEMRTAFEALARLVFDTVGADEPTS